MRVLSIVHERDAGPGVFADVALRRGDELVEWVPAEQPPPALHELDAALVFGGGMNVDEQDRHPWLRGDEDVLRWLLSHAVPVLGVCLGAQLLAVAAGGSAHRSESPEIGWLGASRVPEAADDPVLGPLPSRFDAFQWHSYEIVPPRGAVVLATSPRCVQAFRVADAPAWGVQFHAEVTEATIAGWLRDYRSDEDAIAGGLEPAAVLERTAAAIGPWNALGAGIAERFLAHAARA